MNLVRVLALLGVSTGLTAQPSDPESVTQPSLTQASIREFRTGQIISIDGARAWVADITGTIAAFDLAADSSSVFAGGSYIGGMIRDLVVRNGLAYIADEKFGLRIVDVSNPGAARVLGSAPTGGKPIQLDLNERYAFVAVDSAGVKIVDIADPANPKAVVGILTDGPAVGVQVAANRLYVTDKRFLHIIDVSDIARPAAIGKYQAPGVPWSVSVSGNLALVCEVVPYWEVDTGVRILDVSEPQHPKPIGQITGSNLMVLRAILHGSLAYLLTYDGILVFNIEAPNNPIHLGGLTALASNPKGELRAGRNRETFAVFGTRVFLEGTWYDFTNPQAPKKLASMTSQFSATVSDSDIQLELADRLLSDSPFVLDGKSNNGSSLSYRVIAGPATIQDRSVTLLGTGTVTVRAETQTENPSGLERSFTVIADPPTVTLADLMFRQPGALDFNFGSSLPPGGWINAMLLQPDRKIVLNGFFQNDPGGQSPGAWSFLRIHNDGSYDPSFLARQASVDAIFRQDDGRIVVFGAWTNLSSPEFKTIVRLHPDGTVDETFSRSWLRSSIVSAIPDYDGKILVTTPTEFLRLNRDGSRDTSFTPPWVPANLLQTPSGEPMAAVLPQPDGKLLAARREGPLVTLVRLNNDGAIDPSFEPWQSDWVFLAMALQPDGKILLAGPREPTSPSQPGMLRLNSDGTLDGTFQLRTILGDGVYITRLAVLENGKILIAGGSTLGGVFRRMARLNRDGTLDDYPITFKFASRPIIGSIAIEENGDVIVAGSYFKAAPLFERFHGGQFALPPKITVPPESLTILAGGDAQFRVFVISSSPPTFQWQLNGADIAGATNAVERFADAGTYRVVIRNESGQVISEPVTLTVNLPPPVPETVSTNASTVVTGANGPVYSLLATNGLIYVGGDFTSINGVPRRRLAALRADTGEPIDWDPGVSGRVLSLALDGQSLYVGGNFREVAGEPRSMIAELDLVSGKPTPWNPNVNRAPKTPPADAGVHTLAIHSDRVFAGGLFANVGGQARTNLVAIDRVTGEPLSWEPFKTDRRVFTLLLDGHYLYVGLDEFPNPLRRIDLRTGTFEGIELGRNSVGWPTAVYEIHKFGRRLFVTGFTVSGRAPLIGHSTFLAAVDLENLGLIWRTELPGSGGANAGGSPARYALAADSQVVYVGGSAFVPVPFTLLDYSLLAFGAEAGNPLGWNPSIDGGGTVMAMALVDGQLWLGGAFSGINQSAPANFAVFKKPGHSRVTISRSNIGELTVALIGNRKESYELQSSADLQKWETIESRTLSETWTIPISVGASAQYFRARSVTP